MSLWEGINIANARAIPFLHNNVNCLAKLLKNNPPGIIVVDSIYSTVGTISPLADYVALAREYNCLLVVDESHSLGTHGPLGKGLVYELGLSEEVDIITASLAKSFSGRGGLITASEEIIHLLRYTANPFIFSSAVLPHDLHGFKTALKLFREEVWRRDKVHSNALFLRTMLKEEGFNIGNTTSQIIPLIGGLEEDTKWLKERLEEDDIYGALFCDAATRRKQSLIRLSVNCNHKQEELLQVVECLKKIRMLKSQLPIFKK